VTRGGAKSGGKKIGANVTGVQGDVANLGDLDRLFAQIKREKGSHTIRQRFERHPVTNTYS
jgi:hypothetical protein